MKDHKKPPVPTLPLSLTLNPEKLRELTPIEVVVVVGAGSNNKCVVSEAP